MPYKVEKNSVGGRYRVVNPLTGKVYSRATSLRRAQAQVRLLNAKEHGKL